MAEQKMKSPFGFSVYGMELDVDEILSAVSLVPTAITRHGQRKGLHPANGTYVGSSLSYSLGDGFEVPFDEQQAIAISYMQQHCEQLRILSTFSGVDRASLGLHYRFSVANNVVMFSIELSPHLMWHALNIGYRLSEFVELERIEPDVA